MYKQSYRPSGGVDSYIPTLPVHIVRRTIASTDCAIVPSASGLRMYGWDTSATFFGTFSDLGKFGADWRFGDGFGCESVRVIIRTTMLKEAIPEVSS